MAGGATAPRPAAPPRRPPQPPLTGQRRRRRGSRSRPAHLEATLRLHEQRGGHGDGDDLDDLVHAQKSEEAEVNKEQSYGKELLCT